MGLGLGFHVLERTAELGAGDVHHGVHLEVGRVEDLVRVRVRVGARLRLRLRLLGSGSGLRLRIGLGSDTRV